MIDSYIPNEYFKSIQDIDYSALIERGIKVLFFDLDNTLADYATKHAPVILVETINLIKEKGLKPIIISNNHKGRVDLIAKDLDIAYLNDTFKPFTFRIKWYMKKHSYKKEEIAWVGDQLMTDIKIAHKLNIHSILVDPIRPETEKWYTRINRMFERNKIRSIKKKRLSSYNSLGLEDRLDGRN